MKRYRITSFSFDTRATLLETYEGMGELKEMDKENKAIIELSIQQEYGILNYEQKKKDFLAVGINPFSVIAYHNIFLKQARNAFITGNYYPSLTGACALGERILNHLLLNLRKEFKDDADYASVAEKKSFSNWKEAIRVLSKWKILLPTTSEKILALAELRHKSLHFNPKIDIETREIALKAIILLQEIIACQFSAFGTHPWFLGIPGEMYIKKEWESHPFIKLVYLPNAHLLGYKHKVLGVAPWRFGDHEYEDKDISDDEFAQLRKEALK